MSSTRTTVLASLTTALLVAATPAPVAAADATVPGDRWEITSQMSMEGLPAGLAPNKVKICTPKTWTEPPGGADNRMRCVNSNFTVDGPKVTWTSTRAGPPAMTGTGEITRNGDADWSGLITYTSGDGTMKITLSGHKLEDCEARP